MILRSYFFIFLISPGSNFKNLTTSLPIQVSIIITCISQQVFINIILANVGMAGTVITLIAQTIPIKIVLVGICSEATIIVNISGS